MSDYSWIDSRSAGVLAHISSLPSSQGIGSLGTGARDFLRFVRASGFKYWQICPIGPTSFGDSPYQSFSAFAGNAYFIDLDELADCGMIQQSDYMHLEEGSQSSCDYGKIYENFTRILIKAFKNRDKATKLNFKITFEDFEKQNSYWLEDYAKFRALKKRFGGAPWYDWPKDFANHKNAKLSKADEEEVECIKFAQWIFANQYNNFKSDAAKLGVEIIGDLPIFLSYDSADVWANPELFELDGDFKPVNVAGVGPDYFSPTGQLWGNPLYDWKNKKGKVFDFWKLRLAQAFKLYDVVRLDHFRGFADYWAIPYGSESACNGKWLKAPAMEFFDEMRKTFKREKFIAEDLGLLSRRAEKLRDDLKIPSMAVLQFAFGGDASNPYLPHNLKPNMVCYTGTHDNDTSISWYKNADEKTKDQFRRYFASSGDAPNWTLTLAAMTSVSKIAIIPMQDVLGLDGSARMNTPGKASGNWKWRMSWAELRGAISDQSKFLRSMCELTGRLEKKIS